MAYGVILKHFFKEGGPFKRGADGLFGRKEGRGALFLTGVERTLPV
jgi:hypothetical protein